MLKSIRDKVKDLQYTKITLKQDTILSLLGKMYSRIIQKESFSNIQEAEFKVFSQWGEDGIIQYLISKIPIENRTFIEFGVENYSESNTRFLMINNNWNGLLIDGGNAHEKFLKRSGLM